MTFNAILLPRVEKAGGGQHPSLAAGQPIVICGSLSGRETGRRGTYPVSRPSVGGSTHFRHAGRRFVRRDLGADAFARVQGFGGRQATTGHRSPNLFLGLGRAIQPFQKPARAFANTLHLPSSLRDAPASEMQETTEGIPDERKPTARDGNLTARERKNAC